jgi:hypothetical protein
MNSYAGYGVVAAIGFIVKEKVKEYHGKQKAMTSLMLDINGHFFDEVLWPEWGKDRANSGFDGKPCLVVYKIKTKGVDISKVIPLIKDEETERYNIT